MSDTPPDPEDDKPRRSNPAFRKIVSRYLLPAYLWLYQREDHRASDKSFRSWVALQISAEDAAKVRSLRVVNRKESPNRKWRRSGVRIAKEDIDAKVVNGASYCATKIKDMLLRGGFIKHHQNEYQNKPLLQMEAVPDKKPQKYDD